MFFGPDMPANIAVADLNGDGFPDVIVNDLTDTGIVFPTVYSYINQKDGTFKIAQDVDTGDPRMITNVALGDTNGDGCPDVVDTDSYGDASVFLGNCDGTFQNQTFSHFGVGEVAGGLVLTDINGDGKLDIVTSSIILIDTTIYGYQPGNVVTVLLGDGQGDFSNAKVYQGDPSMSSLALADLNGDGHPDVIAASQDADSVSIFLNDGSGGLGTPDGSYLGYISGTNQDVTNAPLAPVKVADVNGDGKPDLVLLENGILYPDPFCLTVLLNDGKGNFSTPIRSAVINSTLTLGDFALGDFRNTGRPDFIAVLEGQLGAQSPSFYIAFAKNNGDATFTPLPLTSPPGAQGLLGRRDFNHDGKLDFVTVQNVFLSPGNWMSTLNVFLGKGDRTFARVSRLLNSSASQNYPVRVLAVGVDFNGDGELDVLVHLGRATKGTQGYDVYEFTQQRWTEHLRREGTCSRSRVHGCR